MNEYDATIQRGMDAVTMCELAIKDMEPWAMQIVVCMLIDYVAMKNEISSTELIERISPVVKDVNDEMGKAGIEL